MSYKYVQQESLQLPTDANFLRGEHVEENSMISREQLGIPRITE